MRRDAIGKRVRYDVLRRFNFNCFYCGLPAGPVQLHIDHLIPHSLGGSDDETNLVPACRDCNLGKADSMPNQATIDRARDAYRAYVTAFGHRVIPCTFCGAPVVQIDLADDEEEATECDGCNTALCQGYDAGLRAAGGR